MKISHRVSFICQFHETYGILLEYMRAWGGNHFKLHKFVGIMYLIYTIMNDYKTHCLESCDLGDCIRFIAAQLIISLYCLLSLG